MYTQCPECSSIFEIAATDLAVAGGFVRCGQCAVSFDALNSLSDNSAALRTRSRPSKAKSALQLLKTRTGPENTEATKSKSTPDASADNSPESAIESKAKTAPASNDVTDAEQDTDKSDRPDTAEPAGTESTDNEDTDTVDEQTDSATAETDDTTTTADVADADSNDTDDQLRDQTDSGEAESDDDISDEQLSDDPETPGQDSEYRDSEDQDSDDDESDDDDDDDEILLDDAYQPPQASDDDEYYDDALDEEYDDTLIADDSEAADLIEAEIDEAEFDNDDESFKDTPDADQITTNQDADESALFTLPLPELTALEHDERAVLPEKLEGGEAAHDPSAQTSAQARPVEAATQTASQDLPSIWARQQNDAYDAEDARDLRDYLSPPVNRAARAAWLTGSALMAVMLVVQIIHSNRGDLVIHPRVGPLVSKLYRSIGVELRPNWQVNDYKVVGQARLFLMPLDEDLANSSKDETDPNDTAADAGNDKPDATAIRFVAIISNSAKQPQPPPMVRLTLRDRWGDPTGARDFTPPEYLADRAMIGQLLEPGQRLRVVLNLYDFGSDAVGFDFDMCMPDNKGVLRCAHEG